MDPLAQSDIFICLLRSLESTCRWSRSKMLILFKKLCGSISSYVSFMACVKAISSLINAPNRIRRMQLNVAYGWCDLPNCLPSSVGFTKHLATSPKSSLVAMQWGIPPRPFVRWCRLGEMLKLVFVECVLLDVCDVVIQIIWTATYWCGSSKACAQTPTAQPTTSNDNATGSRLCSMWPCLRLSLWTKDPHAPTKGNALRSVIVEPTDN